MTPTAPIWVRTPDALAAMAAHLAGSSAVALDTESDSLHHFPEKVCLLQAAHADGTVYLADPLALGGLEALAPLCAADGLPKVFHGAAYDVASLKRDFGFRIAPLVDTMLAAQFLGLPELGLTALLERFFGLPAAASRQKDDWARRPLTAEQEAYAAGDVLHLLALWARLRADLAACGREAWLAEECAALVETPAACRVFDPEEYQRIKGARLLDGRGLAVLRALYLAREGWAQAQGRPPFRLLGNESMLHLATRPPRRLADLTGVPGCTPKVVGRLGERILEAVAQGLAVPVGELPRLARGSRPRVSPAVQRRIEALATWRGPAAARLGLDPGLVLPRRLVERLAERVPGSREELEAVEGLRRWRVEALGAEILAVLDGGRSRWSGGGQA